MSWRDNGLGDITPEERVSRMGFRSGGGLAVLVLVVAACSPSSRDSAQDGGSPRADAGQGQDAGRSAGLEPVDLDAAQWALDDVVPTPETLSHHPSLTFTSRGDAWLAWAEPDSAQTSDQDIFTAHLEGTPLPEPRTHDVDVQDAFPVLRADGEVLHLVFSGYPGGDQDVFYLRRANGAWTERADLTSAFETGGLRSDYQPVLALGAQGSLAIAYLSEPRGTSGQTEVRVIRMSGDVASVTAPVTVMGAAGDGCSDPAVSFDARGRLHVAASCGPLGAASIHHAVEEGGAWHEAAVALAPETDDLRPSLGAAPGSGKVYLGWMRSALCETGSCSRILVSVLDGAAASAPVTVEPTASFAEPVLGVDPFGRVLLAFHADNAQGQAELYFVHSDNEGAAFSTPRNLTPGNQTVQDWSARDWAFDAKGKPHFVSVRILNGSNPLNTEIIHGHLN